MLTKEQVAGHLLKEQILLTAFISSITRDYQSAEDVFQDVCVKAISLAETFTDFAHLMRWARMASRNKAIDFLRASRSDGLILSERLLDILQHEWPTHDRKDNSVAMDALADCLKRLTENNRTIIRLRYFNGMSGIEVAEYMKRKAETIYQALARIHKQLGVCVRRKVAHEQ